MHPWGKWGRLRHRYGVHAARAALADAGIAWEDVDLVVGGETVRNGYAGYVAGATFAQALGWNGARVATSYAACATGAQALDTARARILAGLCEVALVVGADTTPKGFLAPNAGERWDDPDWLRFRLLGHDEPGVLRAVRAPPDGPLRRHRGGLRRGQGEERPARAGQPERPLPQGGRASTDVLASPVVSDPLHLLDICATSDGAAAVVLASAEYARRHGLASPVRVDAAISTVTPTFPNTVMDMPNISTDPQGRGSRGVEPERTFKESIARRGLRGGRHRSRGRRAWPRSTTCPPRWSWTGWRTSASAARRGRELLRAGETTIGGRIPVNPSGGLACFGEAVPAQALAQVCEVTWQLRGQAAGPTGRGRLASASRPTRGSSATARRCC